ncbi:MAG: hypothetical protein D6812_12385 [Deltaproteobacteria bacterium]|nr:MAG: hypothetical protein D6812_12385 [Deltaproteobacteria bacterium]
MEVSIPVSIEVGCCLETSHSPVVQTGISIERYELVNKEDELVKRILDSISVGRIRDHLREKLIALD